MSKAVRSFWVNCPVCGAPDTHKTLDAQGRALFRCTNHECASNGGPDAKALARPRSEPVVDGNAWFKQLAGAPLGAGNVVSRYSVERHGSGWAIYLGRDAFHHGANLGHLTETTQDIADQIGRALNLQALLVSGNMVNTSTKSTSIAQ